MLLGPLARSTRLASSSSSSSLSSSFTTRLASSEMTDPWTNTWPQGAAAASASASAKSKAPVPPKLVSNPPVNGTSVSSSVPLGHFDLTASVNFAAQEQKVLNYWKQIDAFQTSLKLSQGKPRYTFYDGPPFATGLPHYGHLLAGTIKDVVTRYAHQTGHYVERRFGWDCHGVPVEFEIDKKLCITSAKDVEKLGIDKYNAECRAIVMRYSKEWEATVNRIGRWIDFDRDYKTMNTSFMESVWWVFKQLHDKGQVYRGFRVMPYSTGLTTPLSNFEAGQNYKDVADPAVVVSFPLKRDPSVSFLAWTTTPWTLPCNLALCSHPDMDYVKVKDGKTGALYILMEKRLEMLYKDPNQYTILEKFKGSHIKGWPYEPIYPYFASYADKGAFVMLNDTYVTDEGGTGIVHQAPAFGEDDYRVCVAHKVVSGEGDIVCPVDASGIYTEEIKDYAGQYVKTADKQIMKDLKRAGRLIQQSTLTHSYPFCWRSDTPLIYRTISSWFVRVSNIKDELLKANEATYWQPSHVKEKRFANWLENARDWNISRNRYWGTPIPLWVSDDLEEIVAVGSVEELRQLSGCGPIVDIHRESIDHITIPSKKGKGVLRRTSEIFDCWFESGSMPFAQQHYPFENKDIFPQIFPADFISEGIDQTRGWFYTLLVLSTHLMGTAPWKNLIVSGLVLAEDGKKMSKRLKNYPDPNDIIDKYGADAVRLYLVNSPAVAADTLRFKEKGVKDLLAQVFIPWYNVLRFFFTQIAVLKKEFNHTYKYDPAHDIKSENVMDRWILASTQSLIGFTRQEMAAYRLYTVTPRLLKMIDELTNWYVRFNRRRLKGENGLQDAVNALDTLAEVLYSLCRLMAPFTPFITENMYQVLRSNVMLPRNDGDDRSIHFLAVPDVKEQYFDDDIQRAVSRMQTVIEAGRVIRDRKMLPVKTPLRELILINADPHFLSDVQGLESYVVEELNIRAFTTTSNESAYGISYKLEPDMKALGRKLGSKLKGVKAALSGLAGDKVQAFLKSGRLTVEGVDLTESEVVVVRSFADNKAGGDRKYETHSEKDVLVVMDVALDQSLIREGLAREIVNRVQQLRKKTGLVVTDEVDYRFKITKDSQNELAAVMQDTAEFLAKQLKQPLIQGLVQQNVIAEEEQEVGNSNFTLALVKKG
ncbi:isoleucine---tRNA ligase [Synchytrium endobioticum]|uniref:Isoleucine--tRNA ligase, cytoplasmic n=1 Tax=Synchytrium endobioticum TaxID=286115 RepID=A0A507CQK6_9FUNG|nr:isoleucine---tRNA ligase [Synchytrium endobioticum]TPX42622.1 isoleucine---tRNA ligase [Synchytrium endobioticum]